MNKLTEQQAQVSPFLFTQHHLLPWLSLQHNALLQTSLGSRVIYLQSNFEIASSMSSCEEGEIVELVWKRTNFRYRIVNLHILLGK